MLQTVYASVILLCSTVNVYCDTMPQVIPEIFHNGSVAGHMQVKPESD